MSAFVAGVALEFTRAVVTWWAPRGVDGVTVSASIRYLPCFRWLDYLLGIKIE
jgi:hypothetical protein